MKVSCHMNFKYYPLDVQDCLLDFASYAYTVDDIENPVQIKSGVDNSLPQFIIQNITTAHCSSITNTGNYSCLRVAFDLYRQIGYYLFHLYLPGAMLVMVSWVSFWLDPDAVPGRVTLGVTTLLTMATQASTVNNRLPPVSYIKAIDVWIGMCTCFLFGALIEFAIVTFLYNRQVARSKRLLKGDDSQRLILDDSFTRRNQNSRNDFIQYPILNRAMGKIARDAKAIDAFSRISFPVSFLLCNIVYWWCYTKERFQVNLDL
uniref:Uncharacterized protein n=1 Tax=Acrobeloides nanus TaxID=290746 RepID=A0A914E1B4_9BILA